MLGDGMNLLPLGKKRSLLFLFISLLLPISSYFSSSLDGKSSADTVPTHASLLNNIQIEKIEILPSVKLNEEKREHNKLDVFAAKNKRITREFNIILSMIFVGMVVYMVIYITVKWRQIVKIERAINMNLSSFANIHCAGSVSKKNALVYKGSYQYDKPMKEIFRALPLNLNP